MRARGSIDQAGRTLLSISADPLPHRLGVDAEGQRDRPQGLTFDQYPPYQFGSTVRRQAGILVYVYPVLLPGL
jgi:hypothetical protein